jgi:hypothetical protein
LTTGLPKTSVCATRYEPGDVWVVYEDGLDVACEMIAEALPQPLRETAYALACDVAAADGVLASAELEVLSLLRRRLNVDRLVAAAIERATYARHAIL